MSKKIVCFCQDLSESDIIRAIEEGYDNLEILKRYTGAFMGPCQGKMCASNVLKTYCEKTGRSIEEIRVPTIRPPVDPIPLGWLDTIAENNRNEQDL